MGNPLYDAAKAEGPPTTIGCNYRIEARAGRQRPPERARRTQRGYGGACFAARGAEAWNLCLPPAARQVLRRAPRLKKLDGIPVEARRRAGCGLAG